MKEMEETQTLHICLTVKAKWADVLKDWADGQHSSFSKGTLMFHGGQQRYLPEQFRPGQRVYLWKTCNSSCLLHEILDATWKAPPKNPKGYLKSIICALFSWDLCSLAYIPSFIKPTFPDCTVNKGCMLLSYSCLKIIPTQYLVSDHVQWATTEDYSNHDEGRTKNIVVHSLIKQQFSPEELDGYKFIFCDILHERLPLLVTGKVNNGTADTVFEIQK